MHQMQQAVSFSDCEQQHPQEIHDACRVHAVLLVVLHLTDAPGDTSTVFIIAENAFLTCFCKSCADVTQLYDGGMDRCV